MIDYVKGPPGRKVENRRHLRTSPRSSSTFKPVLVVHGGAGLLSPERYKDTQVRKLYEDVLRRALRSGNDVLKNGGNSLDAAVAACVVMEDSPLFNAGRGAVYNVGGFHQLEVSLMTTSPPTASLLPSRRGASATLLEHVKNPSKLARELYLDESVCKHALISGVDAERIAGEKGLEIVENGYFDTRSRWLEHRRGLGLPEDGGPMALEEEDLEEGDSSPDEKDGSPKGTIGAVALDSEGRITCVTSTGGVTNKNVGRIGDTPSMGSGFWAERWEAKRGWWGRLISFVSGTGKGRDKKAVGMSGTGDGDYFIRQNTAHEIVSRMKYLGQSLREAAKGTLGDLKGMGGDGGLIGIDQDGCVVMEVNCTGMFRGFIREDVVKVAIYADEELH